MTSRHGTPAWTSDIAAPRSRLCVPKFMASTVQMDLVASSRKAHMGRKGRSDFPKQPLPKNREAVGRNAGSVKAVSERLHCH